MSFVAAKFPLPTVTKADGTLGGYVQYPVNPGGPQFIWPAQRVAIFLAKQKAVAAKKKSGALGAVTLPPAGPATDVVNAVFQTGPNATLQPNAAYQDAVDKLAPKQPNNGMSYALALGGILVGGGVIIALVKALSGGARTGRPIPGAHVYEGL
jgi:hypothetical protein